MRRVHVLLTAVLTVLVVGGSVGIAVAAPADGTRDTTFVTGGGFNNVVYDVVDGGGGTVVAVGAFTGYDGTPVGGIVRLTSTGAVDPAFATGIGFNGTVTSIATVAGGGVVVGGSFTTYQGTPVGRIARLLPSGALDTSLITGTGFDIGVDALAVIGTDIVAGGRFTTYNGTAAGHIVRLDSAGTPSSAFGTNAGAGFDANVSALAVDGTGRILAAGDFTTFGGTTAGRLARLSATGVLDTGFNAGSGLSARANAVAVDAADGVVVGGQFTSVGGTAAGRVARFTAAGTLDTGFVTGAGFDGIVNSLALESDGSLLVGGGFTAYDGTTTNQLARLSSSGTVDARLATGVGTGFGGLPVAGILVTTTGDVVAAGPFGSYRGTTAGRIVRLTAVSFTVSYDLNGAAGSPPTSATVPAGSPVMAAAAPTRPGYTFAGWNTATDGSGATHAPMVTFVPTANTTLFARWTGGPSSGGGGSTATPTTATPTTTPAALAVTGVGDVLPLSLLGAVLLLVGAGALRFGRRSGGAPRR